MTTGKDGLSLNNYTKDVAVPKVTGGLKLKAPKLKVKAKAGGKAKVGAKAKIGGKAKVGLKVKAKKDRRLQKKEDTATPSMTTGKDGLSLNNYTKKNRRLQKKEDT